MECKQILQFPWQAWWGRTLWIGLVLGLLLGIGLLAVIDIWHHFPAHAIDFAQHYFLGYWVNHGGRVTDPLWPRRVNVGLPAWMNSIIPYLPYQPLLLPVMRLLALFPYSVALLIWLGGASLFWWWLAIPLSRSLRVSPWCIRFVIFFFPSLWFALYLGNLDAYLAGLVTGAALLRHNKRWWWSGFLWGWIGAFKPFLLFGMIPALRQGRLHTLLGLLLGGLSAFGWALWAVGPEGLYFFLLNVPLYSRHTFLRFLSTNTSLTGWLAAWIGPTTPYMQPLLPFQGPIFLFALGVGCILFGVTFWIWKDSKPLTWLDEGLWLSLALLLSPISWTQYRIYLLIPALHLTLIMRYYLRPLHKIWYSLLPLFLTDFLWGRFIVYIVEPYPVIPLVLGTLNFLLWMVFLLALSLQSKHLL